VQFGNVWSKINVTIVILDSHAALGSTENSISALMGDASNSEAGRRRNKKSRWATSNDGAEGKTFIPGMPTILPSNLNPDQQEAYLGNYKNASCYTPSYTHVFYHTSIITKFIYIIF
jgi:hypothetical protein